MSHGVRFADHKWFEDHFCKLYEDIVEKILRRPDQIRGRVLDVGCESGITDLAIALKDRPREIIGADVYPAFANLLQNANSFGLRLVNLPKNLRFVLIDGERLPFDDNYFDLVLSRDTFEHIDQAKLQMLLDEIYRVLRSRGVFYLGIVPLYYSSCGHHLAKLGIPAHAHLNMSEEKLEEIVRANRNWQGYWDCFLGLNKLTISELEELIKQTGFRFVRAYVRTDDVEYSDRLEKYSIVDLAISQIHWVLKK